MHMTGAYDAFDRQLNVIGLYREKIGFLRVCALFETSARM